MTKKRERIRSRERRNWLYSRDSEEWGRLRIDTIVALSTSLYGKEHMAWKPKCTSDSSTWLIPATQTWCGWKPVKKKVAGEEESHAGVSIRWRSLTVRLQKCENAKRTHVFEVLLEANAYLKYVFVHVIEFIKISGGEHSAGGVHRLTLCSTALQTWTISRL